MGARQTCGIRASKRSFEQQSKIEPDPRDAPGYLRYEGAGLEMIYNPKTGQVGHIQPVKVK